MNECLNLALVRTKWDGQIAIVDLPSNICITQLARHQRVVIDIGKGEQIGELLGSTRPQAGSTGRIIRATTPEDELRYGHLRQFAQKALEQFNGRDRCWVLAECEPLLDGVTLLLQFVDSSMDADDSAIEEISSLYYEETLSSEFVKKVVAGCGPNCGSAAEVGCGTCKACNSTCSERRMG